MQLGMRPVDGHNYTLEFIKMQPFFLKIFSLQKCGQECMIKTSYFILGGLLQ